MKFAIPEHVTQSVVRHLINSDSKYSHPIIHSRHPAILATMHMMESPMHSNIPTKTPTRLRTVQPKGATG
jgi:hypothetical protein